MCFFFVFQIFLCVRVCIIINFINRFRQMHVNTRRQTAGLSPLIKKSKENSSRTNTSFGTCTHSGSRVSTRFEEDLNVKKSENVLKYVMTWMTFNNSILIFVCHNKFFVCVITRNNFYFYFVCWTTNLEK